MAKKTTERELWKDIPDEHDFPAALSYLSLICGQKIAEALVDRIQMGARDFAHEKNDCEHHETRCYYRG